MDRRVGSVEGRN